MVEGAPGDPAKLGGIPALTIKELGKRCNFAETIAGGWNTIHIRQRIWC
jgi:hypothetical protein